MGLLRRDRNRGRSGQYLVGFGLFVLTVGLFTDTLGARLGAAGVSVSVLELGVLGLVGALARLAVRVVLRKLKRGLLKGALAGASFGVGLPALGVAIPALPFVGRLARRLPVARVARIIPGFGVTRLQRLQRAVGGLRGVGVGGMGATLLTYGAQAGRLGETYTVFGTRTDLLTLFLALSVPGAALYAVRNW